MTHMQLLGQVGNYELSIEPITFRSLLSRYSHVLVVRENGCKVDAYNTLYLSPDKESGLSDSDGYLSWYRAGLCHISAEGGVMTQEMSFTDWLFCMIARVRTVLMV